MKQIQYGQTARYLAAPPTLNDGEGGALLLDAQGKLVTSSVVELGATIFENSNSDSLAVSIVDANGDPIVSFGGGTQYQSGSSTVANPIGTGIVFDDDGVITFVSDTAPLPVTASLAKDAIPATGVAEAVAVQIVDSDGNQIISFGGGSQYSIGDAAGSTDVGTLGLFVRDDTLTTLSDPDGDYTQGRTNNRGALWVKHDGTITAALSTTDNAVLDAIALSVASIDTNQLPDGHNVTVDNASIAVTGTFWQTTQPISGTVTANLSAVDNAVLDQIEANQDTQTGILTTIDTDTSNIATDVDTIASTVATIDNTPLTRVAIFDDNDTQITSFGGGSQYAIDTAYAGDEIGNVMLAVRDDDIPGAVTPAEGDFTGLKTDEYGSLWVSLGTKLSSDNDSIASIDTPATSGGLSTFYDSDLDETAVVVKAGAGQVYAITAFNTTETPLYLQLFNVAQGSVTVGTTTPTAQFLIPGNSTGAGFVISFPQGIEFDTAITAACSTDSEGNSAPDAGACITNIFYA